MSLKQVKEVVGLAKDRKIRTVLHFIFGAPGETWDTVRTSIDFACKADPDFVGFNILTPYPGSEVSDDLKRRNMFVSDDWAAFDQSNTSGIRTEHLSPEDLARALKIANREFYFRPRYIRKRLAEIKDLRSFSRYLYGFVGLLKKR